MQRRHRPRTSLRGATKVEYAILLFLLVVVAAIVFKIVGNKVGHAGSETVQRFDGKGGEGDKGGGAGGAGGKAGGGKAGTAGSAAGAGSAGGGTGDQAGGQVAGNGAGGGAGGAGASGGGGGGGGGGAGNQGQGSVETNDAKAEDEGGRFPLMKILAAVFVVLFAAAAFFAFRKGKASA